MSKFVRRLENASREEMKATQAPGPGDAPGFLAQLQSCRAEMLAMFCHAACMKSTTVCSRALVSTFRKPYFEAQTVIVGFEVQTSGAPADPSYAAQIEPETYHNCEKLAYRSRVPVHSPCDKLNSGLKNALCTTSSRDRR